MKLKSIHFLISLIVFFSTIYFLDKVKTQFDNLDSTAQLESVSDKELGHKMYGPLTFILFYHNDCDIYKKMESNLALVNEEYKGTPQFYKINMNDYPSILYTYNSPAITSTLIFENGKEIQRIMGCVSVANIKMICNRLSKKAVNSSYIKNHKSTTDSYK